MRYLFLFACLLTSSGAHASPGVDAHADHELLPAPRLERVSFAESANGHTQVVRLHLNGRIIAFSNPQLRADGRLEVWLYNVKRSSDFSGEEARAPVRNYRTTPSRGHVVISLNLTDSVLGDVYRDSDSNDLLISLSPVSRAPVTSPANFSPATRPSRQGTGARPDRVPTNLASKAASQRLARVVIDAGHGGKDPGATAPGRVREKDIVLPIALQLGEYLENRLGVEVIYTRDDDTFIPLRNRGQIANDNGADLFISIHANSAANRSAHGTETYFLGMNKESSAQAVIQRENSVIQQFEQDQPRYEQVDQASLVMRQLAHSAFLSQSEELAARIEHDFSQRVNRKSRGVKEGNFRVLWGAAMPSVLVEVGFVSNAREARFLRSEDGITFMASSIFRAIKGYKADYEESLSLPSDD